MGGRGEVDEISLRFRKEPAIPSGKLRTRNHLPNYDIYDIYHK